MSVDGIGAYDLVSKETMLGALGDLDGGNEILSFVSAFFGWPSSYLWEDEPGEIHDIHQSEGGEQGDALPHVVQFGFPWGIRCCRWAVDSRGRIVRFV